VTLCPEAIIGLAFFFVAGPLAVTVAIVEWQTRRRR
jgi:hypothetical protein